VRRCGRNMNRQDRDRGAEMRLTERSRHVLQGSVSTQLGRDGTI